MDFLWPGLGRRAASNYLRSALHAAREVFDAYSGHRYLASEYGWLALCPDSPLWVDVDGFGRTAATARLAKDPASYRVAIELHAGELLPEDRYEGWAETRLTSLSLLLLALNLSHQNTPIYDF
jgi:DNA-binding SARP family transcriptional activator